MRHVLVVLLVCCLLAAVGCGKKTETSEQLQPVEAVQQKLSSEAPAFILQPSGTEYDGFIGDWIFEAIDKAWVALEDKKAGYSLKSESIKIKPKANGRRRIARKPKVRTVKRLEYHVLLAVMNLHQKDRKIEFVDVDQKGRSNSRGFDVDKGAAKGVGTSYEVTAPTGYVVLAIKRVLKIQNKYQEVVYTPYTAALDVPLVRKTGYEYLRDRITEAQSDLRSRKVKSKVFSDKLVADLVPLRVSLALSIIEHVDPFEFERNARTFGELPAMQALANKALVVVGANREWSYGYAVSKAGARGLFQFIPRTYKSIRKQYKTAGLDSSFVDGMDDHVNGAKASLLLFDSDWSFVQNGRRKFFQEHPDALGIYLAAAYNGGAGRASRAIQDHGDKWPYHVLPETQMYIKKFRALDVIMAQK